LARIEKVSMHVGTIVEVKDFQARKPAYQLTIDFGETELENFGTNYQTLLQG
jgi:tRNA-binding EMAP/Myf-like protein